MAGLKIVARVTVDGLLPSTRRGTHKLIRVLASPIKRALPVSECMEVFCQAAGVDQ